MRSKKKRILGVILSFALLLGLLQGMSLTAFADTPAATSKVTFTVVNGAWNDGRKESISVSTALPDGTPVPLSEVQIPAVGLNPDSGYEAGSWDKTIDTSTPVTGEITYTYTYAKKTGPSNAKVTFKVEGGEWDNGGSGDIEVSLSDPDGGVLKLAADQIPSAGTKPSTGFKTGNWIETPSTETEIKQDVTYTYKYEAKEEKLASVTFKVVNGRWDDEKSADKEVIVRAYEGDPLKLKAEDIPAVGNHPDTNYKAGSWDVTPNTETAITANTTYTYTYAKKEESFTRVTFKVVNGRWDDEKSADKEVTIKGLEGDPVKLLADQIPAVGKHPDTNYMEGSWDVTPSTETGITTNTTYTYTYLKKEKASVVKEPAANTLTCTGSAQELVTAGTASGGTMLYSTGDSNGATEKYTTTIPTATEVGKYYVWYMVEGDSSHLDTSPVYIPVTIAEAPEPPAPDNTIDITGADIELYRAETTYNGRAQKPRILTIDGKEVDEGSDYRMEIRNSSGSIVTAPKNAGTYTITVFGQGNYTGSETVKYQINKAANPLKVKAKTVTLKYSALRKKNQYMAVSRVVTVKQKGQGKLTYMKGCSNKNISVNKTTGKVAVKKGLKKGTYKVKVRITAAGNNNYKPVTRTVIITIKV